MNTKILRFSTTLILTFFLLPALVNADIKIGVAISQTGKYREPATMVLDGYKLWVKQVNERGGLLGQHVQLIVYDDKSNPNTSMALYKKLINDDKVDLVLSPYSSSITYKVSEVTERYHFPLLAAGASDPGIWKRGFRYVFGVYALANRYFIGFADLIAEYGLKTMAIIAEDSRFPLSAAKGVQEWGNRFGIKTLALLKYPPGKPDFSKIINKIISLSPDALVLCAYPDDVYAFINTMWEKKLHPRAFAATIAPAFKDFGSKLGKKSEGIFGPSQWEANSRIPFPGTMKFIRNFKEYTGKTPSYHAASGYAACEILEKAMIGAGILDREKITLAIRSMDTLTVLGRFRVDHAGVQVGHNPIIIQWQRGRREIVWPRRMQTARPVFNSMEATPTGQ